MRASPRAAALKGVSVQTQAEMTEALKIACKEQSNGVTTFIEVLLNQELGEPFRRRCHEEADSCCWHRRR